MLSFDGSVFLLTVSELIINNEQVFLLNGTFFYIFSNILVIIGYCVTQLLRSDWLVPSCYGSSMLTLNKLITNLLEAHDT